MITNKVFQKFVGGALSSLAGMQSFGTKLEKEHALYKFKKKANYLFGTKNEILSKAFTYALSNVGTNFAYSDWDTFSKNNFMNQFFNVGIGMVHGVGQFSNFKHPEKFTQRFTTGLTMYFMHYMVDTQLNQGYFGFDYYDRDKKIGIFSLKSFSFTY